MSRKALYRAVSTAMDDDPDWDTYSQEEQIDFVRWIFGMQRWLHRGTGAHALPPAENVIKAIEEVTKRRIASDDQIFVDPSLKRMLSTYIYMPTETNPCSGVAHIDNIKTSVHRS